MLRNKYTCPCLFGLLSIKIEGVVRLALLPAWLPMVLALTRARRFEVTLAVGKILSGLVLMVLCLIDFLMVPFYASAQNYNHTWKRWS